MWGIVPAAGSGSRIQPLAFSKELLPVGARIDGVTERPRAVSEYLIERMRLAGVTNIVFVIAPGKSDILEYYGSNSGEADVCYVVQPKPAGLCDAVLRTASLIPENQDVIVGLPDTVWFPSDGFNHLPSGGLSFLCFPVTTPELFDAVVANTANEVIEIQVKQAKPESHWVWGAFKLNGALLRQLAALWRERGQRDVYMGTLVNAWLARGGRAVAVKSGRTYIDVGTLHGYRQAMRLLESSDSRLAASP